MLRREAAKGKGSFHLGLSLIQRAPKALSSLEAQAVLVSPLVVLVSQVLAVLDSLDLVSLVLAECILGRVLLVQYYFQVKEV